MNTSNNNFIQRISDEGIRRFYEFENGYAASVICTEHSCGGSEGLWEVAVMDRRGTILYDTPITNDVIGGLDDCEMLDVVRSIRSLPKRPMTPNWIRHSN